MATKNNLHDNKQPTVIAIDGNEANVAQRVGSNVYAFQLLKAMEKYWQSDTQVEVLVFLSAPPLADLPAQRPGWRYKVVPHVPLWTLWKLPLELRRHRNIDLFFSPGHYLPSWTPMPSVNTVMDLAYEHYPQFFKAKDRWQLRLLTRQAVSQAAHVFAISKKTAQDLSKLYSLNPDHISITYPGLASPEKIAPSKVTKLLHSLNVSQPFSLFVGTLQPRKNIVRLIDAFSLLKNQGYKGKLVLAGKVGWKAEPILNKIQSSPYHQDIEYVGFVDDQQKTALLSGAQLLILPGLYEGFGLPPLEAAQLGTLPLVAKTGALPEVVPFSDLQFDPLSSSSIAQTWQAALNFSRKQKSEYLQQLKQHSQQFNWTATGEKVCHQLLSLVK